MRQDFFSFITVCILLMMFYQVTDRFNWDIIKSIIQKYSNPSPDISQRAIRKDVLSCHEHSTENKKQSFRKCFLLMYLSKQMSTNLLGLKYKIIIKSTAVDFIHKSQNANHTKTNNKL